MATFGITPGLRGGGTTILAGDRLELVSVTIPTSYNSTDGISVSSGFSTLRSIVGQTYVVGATFFAITAVSGGTVTVRAFRPPTPSGTNSAATFTGSLVATSSVSANITAGSNSNVITATGTVSNENATETGAAASCLAGCSATHPNTIVAQQTDLIKGSGAVKITALTSLTDANHSHTVTAEGTNSAATFTGAVANTLTEFANTTNLQNVTGATTFNILVIGV